MNTIRIIAALLYAALAALSWGARGWLADIWGGLKVGTQIKVAVGGFTLGMVVLIHLFRPLIVQLFM